MIWENIVPNESYITSWFCRLSKASTEFVFTYLRSSSRRILIFLGVFSTTRLHYLFSNLSVSVYHHFYFLFQCCILSLTTFNGFIPDSESEICEWKIPVKFSMVFKFHRDWFTICTFTREVNCLLKAFTRELNCLLQAFVLLTWADYW